MSKQTLFLDFDGLAQPIALVGCAELLELFPRVFLEGVYRENAAVAPPIIELRRQGDGYLLRADWLQRPIRRKDPVDLVCAFVAELAQARLRCDPGRLWLHAAAAEFSGRLVVFPNTYRAGKSLLSACLAGSGARLFADDVLPIDLQSGLAQAPGAQPRLRLPLPDDLSAGALGFLRQRQGPQSPRYSYLALRDGELAPQGSTSAIGAFVVLQRSENFRAGLSAVPKSEVLRAVIWQNFAREAHSDAILRRLHLLVANAQCHRLTYGRAEEAAEVLHAHFSVWPDSPMAVPAPTEAADDIPPAAGIDPSAAGRYRRASQVEEVILDGERFLSDPQGECILHLNPIGSSLWHLLRDSMSLDEIVTLLRSAFPDIEEQRIRTDVSVLIDSLVDHGLVVGDLSSDQRLPAIA